MDATYCILATILLVHFKEKMGIQSLDPYLVSCSEGTSIKPYYEKNILPMLD